MQAIVTKYIGATNFKGARVKAAAEAGSVTLSWDDSLGTDENHARAARTLATKLGWWGAWSEGTLPRKGSAYHNVYVLHGGRVGVDSFQVPREPRGCICGGIDAHVSSSGRNPGCTWPT